MFCFLVLDFKFAKSERIVSLFEGLLIKNPNFDNIQNFISKYNKLK